MKTRILIVDDNPEIHSDFKKILSPGAASVELEDLEASVFGRSAKKEGFQCELEFASQGQEALEMVRRAIEDKQPYGMAFVDVRMPPGWDGVQTISEILKVDPELGVAICTAYSDYTPEEASRKVGLSNGLMFIIKPFDAGIVRQLAQRLSARVASKAAG